mgnify:CR=1 FL=1
MQRQAAAGLVWSKQFYSYDVSAWLKGDPTEPPPPPGRENIRNGDWEHLTNDDVISMPDKWEYPWYAAWDLAFHMIPFAKLDPQFSKQQLLLFLRDLRAHHLALRRLAASESRWRALSDSSPLGVFHVDARGACTYTNERWQQIYGLSPDESLGTGWSSQVSERDRSTIGEAWRRAAEQGREFSCEFEVCRSDGSSRGYSVTVTPSGVADVATISSCT